MEWPIFILTLEGDDTRRAPLIAQLHGLGFTPELIFGVDGRNGLPPEFEHLVDRQNAVHYGRAMSDGELACALTHQRAYARILDENLPGAIIFEDDTIVGEDFAEFMRADGYEAGDLVIFSHRRTWVRRGKGKDIGISSRAMSVVAPPIGAYGYSLNRRAARFILENSQPVKAPADWPCDISRLDCVAMHPAIVGHPPVDVAQSHLELDRSSRPRKQGRFKRFGSAKYWRMWIRKRLGTRIA